jgi:predicted dehydrogenase
MASSQPLRVGIVGCGVVATAYYLPHLLRRSADFKLVAVCDRSERRAQATARIFGAEESYTDYMEMLKHSDIEAVFILTGPGTHAKFAIAAAESGRHFLLQKPMATNMADTNAIVNAVYKSGVIALIEPSDHSLLDPRYREIRNLVNQGALGDPYWFNYCPTGPDGPHPSLGGNPYGVGAFYSKDSGGFLFDFPYAQSMIVTMLGDCKSVQGLAKISIPNRTIVPEDAYDEYLERQTDPYNCNYWNEVTEAPRTFSVQMEAADNVFSMFEMTNGWIGVFHAGRLFHPTPKGHRSGKFEVWGVHGSLVFGNQGNFASISSALEGKLPSVDEHGWYHIPDTVDWSKSKWPIPPPDAWNYYEASTDHFLNVIRGTEVNLLPVEWGRHITEMMCGAIESAETGQKYMMTSSTTGLVGA